MVCLFPCSLEVPDKEGTYPVCSGRHKSVAMVSVSSDLVMYSTVQDGDKLSQQSILVAMVKTGVEIAAGPWPAAF